MGQNRIDKILKKRTTFGWLFYLIIAFFGKGSMLKILIGFLIVMVGEFFRTFASGIIKKNQQVAKEGPYQWCRHPLYFGSFLISIGLLISAFNIVPFIYFIIFFPLFYIPTMKKEETFLKEKFGKEYIEYSKEVPVFFPSIKKTKIENFSWSGVKKNSEFYNWIAIFLVYIFLLTKTVINRSQFYTL